MRAESLINQLEKHGFGPYTGVPCSFMKELITYVVLHKDTYDYYSCTNEGESIGVAAGLALSGKTPVVLMQNSGLGNTINPLTSLTMIYKFKVLLIISLRGEAGINDEPQHEVMGKITLDMLDMLGIPYEILEEENYVNQIDRISEQINSVGHMGALIVKKGCFQGEPNNKEKKTEGLKRVEAIQTVCQLCDSQVSIISTTGKISRELYYYGREEAGNFYVVGSMGCAASIGFGIAVQNPLRKHIILDGDGAVLMKLGTLSTIGKYKPDNLIHIVLDNEIYESTGGQDTNSHTARIEKIALDCNYDRSYLCDSQESLKDILADELSKKGTVMIVVKVLPGSVEKLGRPEEKPVFYKERFMKHLTTNND